MKNFITGLLLVALCCAPSIAQAGIPREPWAAAAEAPGGQLVASAPIADSPSDTSDYAARETAATQLGQFEGGGGGIYIGTGVLVVALVVVLIIVLLR
jgi:hypothetical protein